MINFFNNSNKFVVVNPNEISLYELQEKDPDTVFIYDTSNLQSLSK